MISYVYKLSLGDTDVGLVNLEQYRLKMCHLAS